MSQSQQRKAPGTGAEDSSDKDKSSTSGLKRLAPESSGILKELEQKSKEESKVKSKSWKKQMLERCGC